MSTYNRPRRIIPAPSGQAQGLARWAQPQASAAKDSKVIAPEDAGRWSRWLPDVVPAQKSLETDGLTAMSVSEPEVDEHALEQERLEREKALALQQEQERIQAIEEQARIQGYERGLEQGRKEGLAQGLAQGLEQGAEQARSRAQETLSQQLAIFEKMAAELELQAQCREQSMAQALLNFGLQIAEHILHQEIKRVSSGVKTLVSKVLNEIDEDVDQITLRLNAEDFALIEDDVQSMRPSAKLRLLVDPQLGRSDVIAQTPHGEIDARLSTRWNQAVSSLGVRKERTSQAQRLQAKADT